MDWVHCNNCYVVPGAGKRFFLTSCGHIYCTDCKISCTAESCRLCGNQCSTIPLSSQMKPDVEMYFTDPLELLKKHLKQVQQVAEFQNNHRARLMVYQTDQVNKLRQIRDDFKRTKEEARKALKVLKEFGEENQKLKRENEYLKSGRTNPNMYRGGGSACNNPGLCTPTFPEKDMGLISRGNSSGGSRKSYENIRGFLSPSESLSSITPGPSRISIRTPPVNGRLGVIGGAAPMSVASNISQGSTPTNSPMSGYPTSSLPRLSELLKSCTTRPGARMIQLPPELQDGYGVKKASVSPYRSQE